MPLRFGHFLALVAHIILVGCQAEAGHFSAVADFPEFGVPAQVTNEADLISDVSHDFGFKR
jgi:hypothetical protein